MNSHFETLQKQMHKENRTHLTHYMRHIKKAIDEMVVVPETGNAYDSVVAKNIKSSMLSAAHMAVNTWLHRNAKEGEATPAVKCLKTMEAAVGQDPQLIRTYRLVHAACHEKGKKYENISVALIKLTHEQLISLTEYVNTLYETEA